MQSSNCCGLFTHRHTQTIPCALEPLITGPFPSLRRALTHARGRRSVALSARPPARRWRRGPRPGARAAPPAPYTSVLKVFMSYAITVSQMVIRALTTLFISSHDFHMNSSMKQNYLRTSLIPNFVCADRHRLIVPSSILSVTGPARVASRSRLLLRST